MSLIQQIEDRDYALTAGADRFAGFDRGDIGNPHADNYDEPAARPIDLFSALSPAGLEAAAGLCGMTGSTPAFRSTLRQIIIHGDREVTVGEAARAYLSHKLAELCRVGL